MAAVWHTEMCKFPENAPGARGSEEEGFTQFLAHKSTLLYELPPCRQCTPPLSRFKEVAAELLSFPNGCETFQSRKHILLCQKFQRHQTSPEKHMIAIVR